MFQNTAQAISPLGAAAWAYYNNPLLRLSRNGFTINQWDKKDQTALAATGNLLAILDFVVLSIKDLVGTARNAVEIQKILNLAGITQNGKLNRTNVAVLLQGLRNVMRANMADSPTLALDKAAFRRNLNNLTPDALRNRFKNGGVGTLESSTRNAIMDVLFDGIDESARNRLANQFASDPHIRKFFKDGTKIRNLKMKMNRGFVVVNNLADLFDIAVTIYGMYLTITAAQKSGFDGAAVAGLVLSVISIVAVVVDFVLMILMLVMSYSPILDVVLLGVFVALLIVSGFVGNASTQQSEAQLVGDTTVYYIRQIQRNLTEAILSSDNIISLADYKALPSSLGSRWNQDDKYEGTGKVFLLSNPSLSNYYQAVVINPMFFYKHFEYADDMSGFSTDVDSETNQTYKQIEVPGVYGYKNGDPAPKLVESAGAGDVRLTIDNVQAKVRARDKNPGYTILLGRTTHVELASYPDTEDDFGNKCPEAIFGVNCRSTDETRNADLVNTYYKKQLYNTDWDLKTVTSYMSGRTSQPVPLLTNGTLDLNSDDVQKNPFETEKLFANLPETYSLPSGFMLGWYSTPSANGIRKDYIVNTKELMAKLPSRNPEKNCSGGMYSTILCKLSIGKPVLVAKRDAISPVNDEEYHPKNRTMATIDDSLGASYYRTFYNYINGENYDSASLLTMLNSKEINDSVIQGFDNKHNFSLVFPEQTDTFFGGLNFESAGVVPYTKALKISMGHTSNFTTSVSKYNPNGFYPLKITVEDSSEVDFSQGTHSSREWKSINESHPNVFVSTCADNQYCKDATVVGYNKSDLIFAYEESVTPMSNSDVLSIYNRYRGSADLTTTKRVSIHYDRKYSTPSVTTGKLYTPASYDNSSVIIIPTPGDGLLYDVSSRAPENIIINADETSKNSSMNYQYNFVNRSVLGGLKISFLVSGSADNYQVEYNKKTSILILRDKSNGVEKVSMKLASDKLPIFSIVSKS